MLACRAVRPGVVHTGDLLSRPGRERHDTQARDRDPRRWVGKRTGGDRCARSWPVVAGRRRQSDHVAYDAVGADRASAPGATGAALPARRRSPRVDRARRRAARRGTDDHRGRPRRGASGARHQRAWRSTSTSRPCQQERTVSRCLRLRLSRCCSTRASTSTRDACKSTWPRSATAASASTPSCEPTAGTGAPTSAADASRPIRRPATGPPKVSHLARARSTALRRLRTAAPGKPARRCSRATV